MLLLRLPALALGLGGALGCGGHNCPPGAEPDCVDDRDCEEVYRDFYDQTRDLYASCGIDVYMPEESESIPDPCSETLKAQMQCIEDCNYGVPCNALDGTDTTNTTHYQTCLIHCQ